MKIVLKMQFSPHPARKTTGQPGQPCPSKVESSQTDVWHVALGKGDLMQKEELK